MLEVIKNAVWSPFTALNLLLLGIIIMIKTRLRTFTLLPTVLRDTVLSIKNNRKAFSLMCTSLGGTIGVGNAVGIAGAIAEGGAGAVFWMAVAGILGMAIKYAEVYLSMVYNGPINYIEKGIGSKTVAGIFSFLCICVSLGMGNMTQVRASVTAVDGVIPLHYSAITLIITFIFFKVTAGGIERIRKFSEIAIPLISTMYVIALAVIIFMRKELLYDAFSSVVNCSGILTGFKWAVIKKGITSGFSKAIFSSEAGLGSAGFSHTESQTSPSYQAKWAIVEVLTDSVICVMTAFALLTFSNSNLIPYTIATKGMFYLSFGKSGEVFYCITMVVFAFSSIICWYYNGTRSVAYLCNSKRLIMFYRTLFAFLIFMSAFIGDSIVIELSDIANGIMLTVNVCALWVLVFKNKLTF